MSRIGDRIIDIPEKVDVKLGKSNKITVKGPQGEITKTIDPVFDIVKEDDTVKLKAESNEKYVDSLQGTMNSIIYNMIKGVVEGYKKTLIIKGVGYKAKKQGNKIMFELGYSHPIEYIPPKDIDIEIEDDTKVTIKGVDKEKVGLEAARIRSFREPTVYESGKTNDISGIKYEDEIIHTKVGKTV
ncbi:MAG: 50S ribosomal protein L6 [Candidatus Mcinerneyibacterium aminivorans]|uniref:50S ribosomal protein L6 n=1 Tax=Candidatus Mcinerneyibacterium aminivorans TaxID=2703815 RepID=A0A5D0MC48_9BACT|nr:MAG: 50S ribosomal protein L6 [Candidatus Mcinerneyibacterium aminivorans]